MSDAVSSEDFQAILAQVRDWVRTRVVPREREIADADAIPDDLRKQAADMGLFGYAIPQAWGGLGLDLTQDVELAMELGYTSMAVRSMFGTNNGIAGQVLVNFGTDEQKATWLERLAAGEVVASFALTEPGAGANPAGLQTRAVRDGDDWVIDGQKRFITNAPSADLFVVFARTRPADESGTGIAVFLVPADAGGVEVGAKDRKMGQEGAWTSDVLFADVRVPAAALVGGDEDAGYRAAMTSLARGRVHIAAIAVGTAQRALDESVAYAASATQGGTVIGDFQLVQAMIADQQTGVLAGRALVRETAARYVSGEDRRIGPRPPSCSAPRWSAGGRPGGAGARRQRLHARRSRRADLPRRPAAAPVRGHQRDPAADHRRRADPRAAAAVTRVGATSQTAAQPSWDSPFCRSSVHRLRLPAPAARCRPRPGCRP